jgi:diacylglycerol kinase (ATP)
MFRQIAVVFHPDKSRMALQRYRDRVRELSGGRAHTLVYPTESHADVSVKAKQAVAEGAELLVAAGGDGTLRGVLEVALASNTPLAPLPLGTSNDYAHALGLHDVDAAAEAALHGRVRAVDVGFCMFEDAQGRRQKLHFCSTAGVGILADVVALEKHASVRRLKPLLGNAIWPLLTFLVTVRARGVPAEIRINDRVFGKKLKLFEISNVTEAGGVAFTPFAELDNGHLDAWMISEKGFFGTASILTAALSGKHLGRAGLDYFADAGDVPNEHGVSRPAFISLSPERPMAIHLNGDHVGFTPAKFGVLPRRLRVLTSGKAEHEDVRSTSRSVVHAGPARRESLDATL